MEKNKFEDIRLLDGKNNGMKQKHIKVILSTLGPLHLIKSAETLSNLVDIKVIQGWIPEWWNRWILLILNRMVGYKLTQTVKKRTPECLKGRNIGIGIPEFYSHFRRRVLKDELANVKAAVLYGILSQKYLKDADIFHVRSGSGMGGAIEKAKACGMKVIVDHSIAHPAFMDQQLKNEFEKNGELYAMGMNNPFWQGVLSDCDKADLLLVNSQFVKDTFVEAGYDEEKIRVVYLGVRTDFSRLKTDYTIGQPIKLLFTGSFGFRKGGEYLLKAMNLLNERNVPCELTIVGGTNGATEMLNRYALPNVKLVGMVPQNNLKGYFQSADMYVFPTLCEGCAQSGMEALASGLPVITTRESGLPVVHGQTGIIIPSKNEQAIADAVMKIAVDKELRTKIGQNAVERMACYTWGNYAKEVCKLYELLVKAVC